MTRAALAVLLLALCVFDVRAHDLITAESAQRYLAIAGELQNVIASEEPRDQRAQASLDLGKTLDEIGELLNRDLEAHGRVQGLASNLLMSELNVRGTALAYSAETNRFTANLQYYRAALKLSPAGPAAVDAMFRLLQGYFYDSFTIDPLRPTSQTRAQLAEQIKLAEGLLKKYPQHPEREETTFILAIHYVQAARAAKLGKEQGMFAQKARALAEEFSRRYPESMRVAALPLILEGLAVDR